MSYYNSLNTFYKSITGAIKENSEIVFRVSSCNDFCNFVFYKDGENKNIVPMEKKDGFFEIRLTFGVGLYWYYFQLNDCLLGCTDNCESYITDTEKPFQLTVYSDDFVTPKWLKGGIIYQIFPDRFFRKNTDKKIGKGKFLHENSEDIPFYKPNENGEVLNNDFFGGDLNGITEKLSYLKTLNVNTIYLNPIFEAYSNHRYDTGDYMKIDSLLGTEEDFSKLISKARELDINIVLDGVFNHTGSDSLYFNKNNNYNSFGAFNGKNSPYRSWFNFTNDNEYQSWWGIKTLPSLNKTNKDYIEYICGKNGVLRHYIGKGVKGWRLDVVDELPADFVKAIRQSVKTQDKDAVIIGEVWEDASNKISYGNRREYFQGKELDSVMNYPLKDEIINYVLNGDCEKLASLVKQQIDHYPKIVLDCLMNILSTHDTFRIFSVLDNKDISALSKEEMSKISIDEKDYDKVVSRLKIASLLQFTLYGVPCIYYGDEVGMQGYKDPLNRKFFPWGKEDKEILSWYRFLGEIRSSYKVFSEGEIKIEYANKGVFAFTRYNEKTDIMIVINLSNDTVELNFEGKIKDLITDKVFENEIKLKAKDFLILTNYKKLQ